MKSEFVGLDRAPGRSHSGTSICRELSLRHMKIRRNEVMSYIDAPCGNTWGQYKPRRAWSASPIYGLHKADSRGERGVIMELYVLLHLILT